MKTTFCSVLLTSLLSARLLAIDYGAPQPLDQGVQADLKKVKSSNEINVAFMPAATEFNYVLAIGEGLKSEAAKQNIKTFMLAPQSGSDINGQMGMIQDVITRHVSAIVLNTHDEAAAAPLVKKAIDQGIAVVIVNSDQKNFPTPVDAVVGYSQRKSTSTVADYLLAKHDGKKLKVGVIEGLPGYHSTERCAGFTDRVKGKMDVVASLAGNWNVEGGNSAAMDLLQAHPEINVIFGANDYEVIGAAMAAKSLGRNDLILLGNDGDTAALEQIASGSITATSNTSPYVMGEVALSVVADIVHGKFPGGFVETPTSVVDKTSVIKVLKTPDQLYPKPSKAY